MKLNKGLFLVAAFFGFAAQGYAYEHPGALGLNYTLGPSFIVGGDGATDTSSVEPGVGAGLQYTLNRNIDLRFDYDYIDAALHTQALTFGGQWKFAPGAVWNPFAGAGLGFGKPFSGEGWDHVSLKLFGGMERELTANISVQPVLTYQYVDGKSPFGSVHVIEPAIRLVYYFGSIR